MSQYQPARASESHILPIRGLSYHVRTWGSPDGIPLLLSHGWMDTSASFQFLVDALAEQAEFDAKQWFIVAPDWRGFGLSDWAANYWFNDYVADMEAVANHFFGEQPFHLVGHSLGGNIASIYAGVRPERIISLTSLEGFGWVDEQPKKGIRNLQKWLDEHIDPPTLSTYADFAELEQKLARRYPLMPADRVSFMAAHWGQWDDMKERVILRADPKHKMSTPGLYRLEEKTVIWENITAPVLWLAGGDSEMSPLFENDAFVERREHFATLDFHLIDNAGHMLHIEQAQECAKYIAMHLKQHATTNSEL